MTNLEQKQRLYKRVNGVGDVEVFNAQEADYAIITQLRTIEDIKNAYPMTNLEPFEEDHSQCNGCKLCTFSE